MENQFPQLLNEQLRPKVLQDLNLPEKTIERLESMRTSSALMNMIFYGKPGIGKTSAARILIKDAMAYELNGSHNQGDKTFINKIEEFCSSVSLTGEPKIIFIDEADYMPKGIQEALRYTIEKFSNNSRFLMTANDFSRMTQALKSRCVGINFDVPPKDKTEVVTRMLARYTKSLEDLGRGFDPERLKEIVSIYFPDLRAVANQIEFEFGSY